MFFPDWFLLLLANHLTGNHIMEKIDLKIAIQAKTIQFENALAKKFPYEELSKIYKELKELQYQLTQFENHLETAWLKQKRNPYLFESL